MFENTEIINHYEWMAYYYINNDSSGYTKDEIAEIDKFEDELKEEYGDSVRVITCSECTGFANVNDSFRSFGNDYLSLSGNDSFR